MGYTEAGELEPTFMDARIRNANNDRFAIEQYWTNPYEVDASGTVPAVLSTTVTTDRTRETFLRCLASIWTTLPCKVLQASMAASWPSATWKQTQFRAPARSKSLHTILMISTSIATAMTKMMRSLTTTEPLSLSSTECLF